MIQNPKNPGRTGSRKRSRKQGKPDNPKSQPVAMPFGGKGRRRSDKP